MTSIKRIAIALAVATATAGLAGCAAPPGSIGEQLWFDQAQGYDIHHVSPQLRIRGAIGYPRTDYRFHGHAPRFVEEP